MNALKRLALPVVLAFLLACAGVMDALTPELPFQMPADAATTNVSINTNNGVSSTAVSFSSESSDGATLQADLVKQLEADGWTVAGNSTDSLWSITGTKGTENITVTITPSASGSGVDIAVVIIE